MRLILSLFLGSILAVVTLAGPLPAPVPGARAYAANLPLVFEASPSGREFVARTRDGLVLVRALEAVFGAAAGDGLDRVRLRLRGANPGASVVGIGPLPGHSHYFTGHTAASWRTNVAQYGSVQAQEIYPGVSVLYYGRGGRLEHDFVVAPGADPRVIHLEAEGARGVSIDAEGNLLVQTRHGQLKESRPQIYQTNASGERLAIEGRFRRLGPKLVGFEVAAYDRSRPLTIDPVLTYGAFLGGTGEDIAFGAALDTAGNVYITGSTLSPNFLTQNPQQAKIAGNKDAFVTKLTPSGTVVYSTYLGGSADDAGLAIAVDAGGSAYVTGFTRSQNFPTTPAAVQQGFGGVADGFVTKLNPSGSALVYSTYLGGQVEDQGQAIAIDGLGNAYVAGATLSTRFPITPTAAQKDFGGISDAFLTKIDPTGSTAVYSTFLGGKDADVANGIALDSTGAAYITGSTKSTNFPAFQAIQGTLAGGSDAFVAKMNAAGTAWVFSSVLGGIGDDLATGIATDGIRIWIVGTVNTIPNPPPLGGGPPPPPATPTFPTTADAYQSAYGGGDSDGFVAVIAGGSVVYASFLGREGSESGQSVVLDQGNAPGSAPGTAWVAVRNAGTVGPPTVKGGPPSTNPPSLCGGPNDLTALFQFDAQFRPTHWSCVNYTATALVAGAGGRLLLAGLASSGDFFATVPPPIPPMTTPELPISSTAVFNGGTVDAVFQLYSTATPASNLESFFPYAQGGTLGPALAGDFDGLGGANDIFVSGPDMARLSGLLNVSPSGPSTSPGSTISTPLSSFPLIATGATVFKDAVTRRNNNIAFVGVPSNSGLSGAGQILVGINNGQGIFGGFQPLVAPPAASNLSHGDFNNDGFDDLAFLDFNTNSAGVLLNDGRNNFKSASFRPTSGAVSIASAVADFDDDGTLDLAVLNQGLPVSGGKFSQGGIALLRGAGDGTLQAPFQLQTAELGLSMAGGLSDIEANGTRRLVDFNNDGYADLAIASARNSTIPGLLNPTVAVYLNQPSNPGTFVAATPADIGGSPSAALGDSFLFSAPQLQFGNNQIGNNSAGSTNAATTVSATQAMPMVAADFDRDGNWDLAVVNPATNTLSIFKGDGRGGLTPAGTYLVGHTPVSVAVADLNGDKMPDLVVSNKDSRSVQVFLNRNPPPAIENPEISAAGVANAASFQGGAVSPGEIVTLFGSGMGPVALTGLQLDATGKVAVQVAGTRVLFDGTPAPIVYTSAGQLSVVVPYAVAGKAHTLIQVEYQGRRSNPVARPVALFRPALFTANSSGTGQAAILNQDASVNSASNPAAKGSVIVIYATGEGQTTPAGVDGAVAGAILPKPPFPVRVKIGEADAAVVYYGAAPGLVSGVLQVNAVVPAGAPSGSAVPVTIILGAVSSPAGVTLAVK